MELERIRELAQLMEETGLSHLEVGEGEGRLVLSRAAACTAPAAAPATAAAAPAADHHDENTLRSPLVGCVYLSPSPGAKPFVQKGSAVKKGQVLCIVEAMKVMNEFTAPRDGTVQDVLVENGQLVEFGQPLFRLG